MKVNYVRYARARRLTRYSCCFRYTRIVYYSIIVLFDLYFLLQVGLFFLNSEAYFENQEEFYTDSEKSQIKIMFGIAGLIALVEMLLCTYGLCLACPMHTAVQK